MTMAKGISGLLCILLCSAVLLLVVGCASQPSSRILGGNLIARGTPIHVETHGSLDFDDRLLLARKLQLFGFAPLATEPSPYRLLVRSESDPSFATETCTIELLKNGVPLVSVVGRCDRRVDSVRAYISALRLFERALYDNGPLAPAIVSDAFDAEGVTFPTSSTSSFAR
jgi:hypothetical protein